MVSLLMALAVARAGCDLAGPSDAPFRVPIRGARVQVVVEVWTEGAPDGWAASVLDAMDARHLPVMIVVPVATPSPDLARVLERVADDRLHDVAIVLPRSAVPHDLLSPIGPLRRSLDVLGRDVLPIHTVIAPVGSRAGEAMLGRAGFRSLVDAEGPPTAEPRMAGHLEGQARINVVLPPGPYEDACGTDPRVGPFTPPAADRASLAIQRAARVPGTPTVRVGLDGHRASPTDAEVLGRWLDEMVLPGQVTIVTAEQARLATLQGYRQRGPVEVLPDVGGRLVATDQVRTAAASLVDVPVIPRALAGDLNPTEAFFSFVLVAADRTEGTVVRLGALHGPAQTATSSLDGPTSFPLAEVLASAKALATAMPTEVPAAFSIGSRLLTGPELLLAFASAVRGEDPVITRPIDVPEPNERGLGWGDSTVP